MTAPARTLDAVRAIADAVLYEGYILYPYRPSSIKNRQRWTFGGVFPQTFSVQTGSDPWAAQTECLVEGGGDAVLNVQLRFLHLVLRDVVRFEPADASWRSVESLQIDSRQFAAWEEAIERDVAAPAVSLAELCAASVRSPFAFEADREREVIAGDDGAVAGAIVRTRHALRGEILLSAERLSAGLYRVRARVENTTPLTHEDCASRALAQRAAFASTHAILRIENGGFVSLTDPPPALAAEAKACVNQGWWPVLAGAEGSRDALLASPIILYDYPQIAPESPGDLFDGTEIDEILTLRILTMTDAEKREAAAADPRTRALLERTEALTEKDMARLHGALRSPAAFPKPALASLSDSGGELGVGDRVRLKPKAGGDIMDIVLADKIAIVEAIERDFEDRVHVAVTIEDDPGRDLGLDRYPGHRFFFSREELEPVGAEAAP